MIRPDSLVIREKFLVSVLTFIVRLLTTIDVLLRNFVVAVVDVNFVFTVVVLSIISVELKVSRALNCVMLVLPLDLSNRQTLNLIPISFNIALMFLFVIRLKVLLIVAESARVTSCLRVNFRCIRPMTLVTLSIRLRSNRVQPMQVRRCIVRAKSCVLFL